jgi:O-antigen/teichoic acid export membrane protein
MKTFPGENIAKSIGYIGLANALVAISSIFYLPLITKSLGAQGYGIFVQFSVSISLVMAFAILGLPYAMVRFLAVVSEKEKIAEDLSSSIILILVTSTVVSFVIILFLDPISDFLFEGNIYISIVLAMIIPIECLNWTLINVFRILHNVKMYALITIVKTYLEIGFVSWVLLLGYDILGVILSIFFSRFFILGASAILIVKYIGFKMPKFKRTKKYLEFGIPTVFGNIASWVSNSSDRYLIGYFLGAAYVGYYNPGYALGGLIAFLMIPINFVLYTVLANYYDKNDISTVQRIFRYSLKYYLAIAIPAAFGISLLSLPILDIITTPEISNQAALITPMIAFGMLLLGASEGIMNLSLFLAKKTKIMTLKLVTTSLINLVLCILLIPSMGIIGAAMATLIAYFIQFLATLYLSFKYFPFCIDTISIFKIIFSAVIMSLFISQMSSSSVIDVLHAVILGFIIYLLSLLCLKAINKKEFSYLNKKI